MLHLSANEFLLKLKALQQKAELEKVRKFFRFEGMESKFVGVRMAHVFALAKEYQLMALKEVEKLLRSDYYEARLGAVSIMDFQARNKKATSAHKKELYELYLKNHKFINNWDLVDRSAPYVVGGYLNDKPRKILYKLAKSKNVWERRTAIVATYYFIRQNDVDDTFKIAAILANDKHDLINKAVGSWVREAGKRDKQQLISFLNDHSESLSAETLRLAVENLEKTQKELFTRKKKNNHINK
ncbi:MAG TPA: DNA alkylation repair protein [Bacteroidia bacterium]|nr:DNA alkylation repair protein [Bacteroidia bacterium]